ncbi:metalloregulator ArsR/SmtB family transcription factor [Nonomuraea phyllanthi]|uniref:Metalloregulator ArsR/SmtB family transcription factor n=1 Tax=Nonomuraea phyllanthi TaxID=2219224 RepID=A0A5C4WED9_9ACTN|nr:helix-turn-helix transcriptional regulator [Nonomuraea phyllanthi]KAB8193187.1 metalloregulator ArsR/SmtB family transcription factor [Nonomuraea phyllanthi]QFY10951.1 metalloregulator ArsR/SmtB family transcription factor [Nonomuraea phyllanthi]
MEYIAHDADIAPVAALIADPTRAAILTALLGGRALAAGELARMAGVSAATASAHLARLLDGGLVDVVRQGRHRYYRLSGHDVAEVLEVLARVSARPPVRSLRQSRQARQLEEARTCYDHLAGRAGVGLFDRLKDGGYFAAHDLTDAGERLLAGLGVDVAGARRSRRRFAPECLDWTERRSHLGGALGAAITGVLLERGWYVRGKVPRAVALTDEGREGLSALFSGKELTSGTPVT